VNRADGIDCYQKALRQGQRDYREKMNAGQSPFLPVLDDILQNVPVENQIPLGQVEIPLELLVGTKTSGRTAAFASNFMPLLGLKTEFATKWINLCVSHVDEGIRDPITCYEYMGRFYVQEGNKRVSVLKYFDASSITGNVTRVVPQYSEDPAVQMYYEFMHFYPVMQNYLLTFTKSGRMVERRDQVLIGRRSLDARAFSIFLMRCRSTNGPFLIERAMFHYPLFALRRRTIMLLVRLLLRVRKPLVG
jgi:hypothetical protein